MTDTTNPQAERYAAALRDADVYALIERPDDRARFAAAVMAVADAEQTELRTRITELESSCRDVDRLRRDWVEMRDRAEQAEAVIERVRRLHDRLATETELASPDDRITRAGAAKRIATALDVVPVSGPGGAADETQQPVPVDRAAIRAAAFDEAAAKLAGLDPVKAALAGQHAWNVAAGIVRHMAVQERRMADGEQQPAPPVEHCIHDRTVHRTHHHTPVTGCPWCTAATSTEA